MKKNRLFKIFLALSLLCGCSSVDVLTAETLVLPHPNDVFTTLFVTEHIEETWEEGEMPALEYANYVEGMGGIKWIASYVEGKKATVTEEYILTYDLKGTLISKTPVIGSRVEKGAVAPKMQFGGIVSVGSEFFPKITSYGVDCYGCNISAEGTGGTSAGISIGLTSVKQPDGSWKSGVKYGDYYIVAADPSIPLCSVLTIYDHGITGHGITAGVPFKAIVLDRGGAIKGAKLDLFVGTEKTQQITNNRNVNTKVVIERVGGRNGYRACKL